LNADIKVKNYKKYFLLAAPLVIMLTVYIVLTPLVQRFGTARGLLYGYLFYWGFWGIIFPLWTVGLKGFAKMFSATAENIGKAGWLLLGMPVIIYPAVSLPEIWPEITLTLVLLSIPLALINGTLEELLWRGTYITAFPEKLFPGYIFPAVAFGIWHVAPYAAMPDFGAEGAVIATIGGTLFGLCWGWAAWKSGSIRLAVISHILANFLALGALSFMG